MIRLRRMREGESPSLTNNRSGRKGRYQGAGFNHKQITNNISPRPRLHLPFCFILCQHSFLLVESRTGHLHGRNKGGVGRSKKREIRLLFLLLLLLLLFLLFCVTLRSIQCSHRRRRRRFFPSSSSASNQNHIAFN